MLEKEIYAAPVAEMVGVACEVCIALSYGAEGAAGGDLRADDTDVER